MIDVRESVVAFDLTPSDRYSLLFSFYLLAFEASGLVVGLVRAIEVGRDGVLARDSDFSSEVESVEIQYPSPKVSFFLPRLRHG